MWNFIYQLTHSCIYSYGFCFVRMYRPISLRWSTTNDHEKILIRINSSYLCVQNVWTQLFKFFLSAEKKKKIVILVRNSLFITLWFQAIRFKQQINKVQCNGTNGSNGNRMKFMHRAANISGNGIQNWIVFRAFSHSTQKCS